MLAFRYFAGIGTGAALALGYATPSLAQDPHPAPATEAEAPPAAVVDTLAARDEVADVIPPLPPPAVPTGNQPATAIIPPGRYANAAHPDPQLAPEVRPHPTRTPVAGRRRQLPAAAPVATPRTMAAVSSYPAVEQPHLAPNPVPPLFESEAVTVQPASANPPAPAWAMPRARRLAAAQTVTEPPQGLGQPLLALATESDTPPRLALADEWATPAAIATPRPPLTLASAPDVLPERRAEIAPPVAPSLAIALVTVSDRQARPATDELAVATHPLPLRFQAPLPPQPEHLVLRLDSEAPTQRDDELTLAAMTGPLAQDPKTPLRAPRWFAQADHLPSQPTDELGDLLESRLQQPTRALTPLPGDATVEAQAAPLAPPQLTQAVMDGRQSVSSPDLLDPSANPLLFPTAPEEVRVDLTQPITLVEAIALARRNNPEFRTAWLGLERAQAGLRAALAALYPTLETSASITRTDSAQAELSNRRRQDTPQELFQSGDTSTITDSFDGRVELSYNLYDGGRRPAQIREAERAIRFNQLEVERIGEQVRLQTSSAYYGLQESDARVDIEQAAVENAQQTLRDAELLEQAGLGTRFDVLRAQVSLANSNQALTNALSEHRVARRRLVQVLGLGQQVEVTIADDIEPAGAWDLPLEDTIVLAYRNRAELEQQLVQREIDEQQQKATLADLRPQVSIFANYNVLGVFNDGEGLADGYQIGARVRWRFFDGGFARARSDQEALDMEIAEVTFEQRRNQVRFEVEEAYSNLRASDENIKTATVAVQLAEESLRLARLRFQAGVGTQTDVIDAQTELTRARGNLLRAIIGYNSALASLQRAVSNVPDNQLFDLP